MDNKIKNVIVFIPTYNEEENIGRLIKRIKDLYEDSIEKGFRIKILVVDDGSTDRTVTIAREAGADHITTNLRNLGLGAAARIGLQTSYEMGADIAVRIDGDFQFDPKDIEKLIMPIIEDKADAVFGSRFLGEIKYKMPFYKKLGNYFFSFLTSLFTGLKITDGQTGIMAFSRRYLSKFDVFSDYNAGQQLIIDVWRKKLRLIEVPVVFYKREGGKSFISLKYPFIVIPNIVRLFIHSFPFKFFTAIGCLLIILSFCLAYLVLFGKTKFFGDASIIILFLVGVQVIFYGLMADITSKR